MAKYKVVIIGCGSRSTAHIRAYQHIDRAEVVACHDIIPDKAEKCAGQFGLTAYTDAAEMIKAVKPDLVHVVTVPTARIGPLTLASDLGVPLCTVEKPLATGVLDWKQLRELEAASQTKFAVCHQFRWYPDFVKCRQAVASGKLGEVRFLDFSAGMNISGQGTHILNYGMSLNGDSPVVRVFGAASGFSSTDPMHPAPDSTAAYLTFANGVRGLWNNGPTAPICGDGETDYQHVRAAAYCEKGRVEWQEFGKWQIVSPDGVQGGAFGTRDQWQAKNLLAQAAFHEAMFDWLEDDGKPAGTNLKQSLHEWQVVLALYAGALQRRPIEIDQFDPPEDLFDQLAAALKE